MPSTTNQVSVLLAKCAHAEDCSRSLCCADSRDRGLSKEQLDLESRDRLHLRLYCTAGFKILVVLLLLIVIGGVVGFFVDSTIGFLGPPVRLTWYTRYWHMEPALVACVATLGLTFLIAIISAFLGDLSK